MSRTRALVSATLLACVCAGSASAAYEPQGERGAKAKAGGKLSFWPDAPDMAEVMTATFIGGAGTEWLVGGGFQQDGTIVLVGNSRGPKLGFATAEQVIGSDGAAPPEPKPVPAPPGKDGQARNEPPSWRHDNATGFVLLCSSDLKSIRSVRRLPWGSAAITAAQVAPDGSIYVAGRATDGVAKLGGEQQSADVADTGGRKSGPCQDAFVAKLSPDAGKVLWLRRTKGLSDAPSLVLRKDGTIACGAQDLRVYDAGGKLISTVVVPGGIRETTSVSSVDGSIVRGGEHHWGTGREPWRCPTLNIHHPDGRLRYQLYDWGGPYVGLDNCRQVSDTAVRMVTHDADGNIYLAVWSDGGNSVATTQPTDVRRGAGLRGLGITAAGMNAGSACYIIKLEPKDYDITGWTMWMGRYGGKPNGCKIDALGWATDGSIVFEGDAAWGLTQTSNCLGDGEPAGVHLAVFSPDMSRVRFCSAMPGTGVVEVANDSRYAIAAGTVGGKPRVLFLSGAVADAEVYELRSKTPVRNAMQGSFGGGLADGYVVMLDLSKQGPPPQASDVKKVVRLDASRDARRVDEKQKNPPPPTPDGTVFELSAATPKYVTVDGEFRDPEAAYWPNFLYGKPVEGTFTYHATRPQAKLTVALDKTCQPKGDQDRRVLGELIQGKEPAPTMTLTIDSLGPMKTEDVEHADGKGKTEKRQLTYADGVGTIEYAGRKVAIKPKVTWRLNAPGRDGAVNGVRITAWFTLGGKDLGLAGKGLEVIEARVSMTAQKQGSAPAPKKP